MTGFDRARQAAEETLGTIPGVRIARKGGAVAVSVDHSVWVRITPMGQRSLVRSRAELGVHPARMAGLQRAAVSPGWQGWTAADDRCLRRLLAVIGVPLGHIGGRANSSVRLLNLLSGESDFREREPTESEFWIAAHQWLVDHDQGTAALAWVNMFETVISTGGRLSRRELETAQRLAAALKQVGYHPPTTDLPLANPRRKVTAHRDQAQAPPPVGRRPRPDARELPHCIHNYPPGICRVCGKLEERRRWRSQTRSN